MIRINSDWKFGLDQSELELIRIGSYSFGLLPQIKSNQVGSNFLPFFIKRDTKPFLDWFGMICIGSDTDIGMNRNSSNWLGMNFYPILLPGFSFMMRMYSLNLNQSNFHWLNQWFALYNIFIILYILSYHIFFSLMNQWKGKLLIHHTEKNSWSNFTQLCRLNLGHKDIWTSIKS